MEKFFRHHGNSRRLLPARVIACLLSFGMLISGIFYDMPEALADSEVVDSGELTEGGLTAVALSRLTCKVARFLFVPEEDAEYEFYSIADERTSATLRSSNLYLITSASGTDADINFSLRYELKAGISYYIDISYALMSQYSGTIYVGVRKPLNAADFEEESPLAGTTDGESYVINISNPAALISFCPEESGDYSIFLRDCADSLRADCYTKDEDGNLVSYSYGESDGSGGLLMYEHFEAGTTYYFRLSPKNGLKEEDITFYFCIGNDILDAPLPSVETGTEDYVSGVINNNILYYTFVPPTTSAYCFRLPDDYNSVTLTATVYDSQMQEMASFRVNKNTLTQNTPILEQGQTYYLAVSTVYTSLIDFSFRIDIAEEDDTPDDSGSDGSGSEDSDNDNSGNGSGDSGSDDSGNGSGDSGSDDSGNGSGNSGSDDSGNGSGNSGSGSGSGIIILPDDKPSNDNSNSGNDTGSNPGGNTGSGNGTGTGTSAKDIKNVTLKAIAKKTYTGKKLKPSVTLKDGNVTLKKGTDYKVSYSNNKNIGTAKVTITGLGKYTGTRTATFKIVPKKTKITKGKRKGKKLTLKWKKIKGATRYQIQYSTSSKFKKAKTKTVKKCSYTLKLPSSKKWYVRIRAYKVVGKAKVYGSYSKAKKY